MAKRKQTQEPIQESPKDLPVKEELPETMAVTATLISDKGEPVQPNESVIKFKVAYSKDYRGKRFWKDGSVIETSRESALQFEKKGLGKCL